MLIQFNRDHGLNILRNPHRVKCALVDCLGVCQKGPILAIYPDGVWYHSVDDAALARIYQEHILGGHPVEELVFHRHYPAEQEPVYPPDARGGRGGRSPGPSSGDAAQPQEEGANHRQHGRGQGQDHDGAEPHDPRLGAQDENRHAPIPQARKRPLRRDQGG